MIRFLLCIIDIYSKYVWVVPLKDSKGFRITNASKKTFKMGLDLNQAKYR